MTWNSDAFGMVFKSSEIKLFHNGSHTWAMKLSQLARQPGTVRIITYTLPDLEYVSLQIGRRPKDILIICHAKCCERAMEIKRMFPGIQIAVNSAVHSKVCLISPKTVYIGSANFGLSDWHETVVGIRSVDLHDWYVERSFLPLWTASHEIIARAK